MDLYIKASMVIPKFKSSIPKCNFYIFALWRYYFNVTDIVAGLCSAFIKPPFRTVHYYKYLKNIDNLQSSPLAIFFNILIDGLALPFSIFDKSD